MVHRQELLMDLLVGLQRHLTRDVANFMHPAALPSCPGEDISQRLLHAWNTIGNGHADPPDSPAPQRAEQVRPRLRAFMIAFIECKEFLLSASIGPTTTNYSRFSFFGPALG